MTVLETGTTGDNPRSLLLELLRQMPHADEATLAHQMRDHILAEQRDLLLPIILYFIRNNIRSLQARSEGRATRKLVAEAKAKIVERLLDMIMLNGKLLRDCTGADCIRLGGWLTRVGKKVGPKQRVGEVLSEQQLRALYQKQ
jgi:hypothetical protein